MTSKLGQYLLAGDRGAFAANFAKHQTAEKVTLQMYELFVHGQTVSEVSDAITQRDAAQRTLLHYAVAGGVKPALCPYSELLRQQDAGGVSALMIAAARHDITWVQYLAEHEAGLCDASGRSALFYACDDATTPESLRIVDFLLDYEWFVVSHDGKSFLDALDSDCEFRKHCEAKIIENAATSQGLPEGLYVCTYKALLNGCTVDTQRVCSVYEMLRRAQDELADWQRKLESAERAEREQMSASTLQTAALDAEVAARQQALERLRARAAQLRDAEMENYRLKSQIQRLQAGAQEDQAGNSAEMTISPANARRREQLQARLQEQFAALSQ